MELKFTIEQIALYPPDSKKAIDFLKELGLKDWVQDLVSARGIVRGAEKSNQAVLNFNYQAAPDKALELEVLNYLPQQRSVGGAPDHHWMAEHSASVSHLGMHVTSSELAEWRVKFQSLGIKTAQEVFTHEHTNAAIAGKRIYNYVIFDTRAILGVDLKFIVRYNAEEKKDAG